MSTIVALVQHPTRLDRLRSAARDSHTVIACDGWDQVFQACEQQLISVAVLDLDAAALSNFDNVRRLKRQNPRLALIAYVALSTERVRHIFDAGRYGFEELVTVDLNDGPSAFSRAIEKASARGVASMIRGELPPSLDPLAQDALLTAITRAQDRLTPSALADILDVSVRVLARSLATSGYPTPHKLIMWGRLVVAAALMDGTRHSADRIALSLSFPSGSAFRNNCQRYLRAKPTQVRALGGVSFVFGLLQSQIRSGEA